MKGTKKGHKVSGKKSRVGMAQGVASCEAANAEKSLPPTGEKTGRVKRHSESAGDGHTFQ